MTNLQRNNLGTRLRILLWPGRVFVAIVSDAVAAAKMENIYLETRFSLDNGGHHNCYDDDDDIMMMMMMM